MPKTTKNSKPFIRNIIKARLAQIDLSAIPGKIAEEIEQVISATRFNKISIPVYCPRYLLTEEENKDTSDKRTAVVGYVKRYNPEDQTFQIVLFANAKAAVNGFVNPVIEPTYTQYNDKLSVITKLVIVPGEAEEEDEATKEDAATTDNDVSDSE